MSSGPVHLDAPTFQSQQHTDQSAVLSSPDSPVLRLVDKSMLPRSRFSRLVYSWLETLGDIQDEKLGMVELHPDVFATHPRMDILHRCVRWQKFYRKINYDFARTRAEMRGGGRKPWPQKGSGRARHGSIRSPLWHLGGKTHGPRGPFSYYQYLSLKERALGLKVALTVKHNQGDLHIVDTLEIPTADPEYLEDLTRYRNWGKSVLLVDVNVPVLSEYALSLESHVKRRYIEKIAIIDIDPVTVPCHQFVRQCLPPVEQSDLFSYLVLQTSHYTNEQFKNYKSLEAYNHVVSGFIAEVKGKIIAGKYVVVAKVRHSQRMNDAPADVWLIVQTDGAVISAHCHCKAGLGESCSHIASVLFYIECWTRINGNLACTQVKCTWILPTYAKAVHYERVRDIDFTSAKRLKENLDHKIDSFTPTSQDSALPSHEETEVEQDSVPPSCEKTAIAEDSVPPSCEKTAVAEDSVPPSCAVAEDSVPPSCEKTAVAEDSVPPSHGKTEVAEESVPTAEEIKQISTK
ncbi:MRPL4 [Branchiostoma lanceolatum]|uniref:Large ribosomal subunit protein uL4m n=1 Tax=Branchiostoma lanceolatum TaxID=7740 RepID=A0A8J9ZW05_BRALA|nr:MRPL4 [Branchiostoma lanceolatum]